MKIEKVLNIVLWVLLIISAFLIVSMMANLSDNETDPTMGAWINTNLVWSYILLGVSAVIAVVAALFQTVTDKQKAKKGLIVLVGAIVVIGVSSICASGAIPSFHGAAQMVADGTLTAGVSKWVGTVLYTSYFLLGLVLAAIVVSSVVRVVKR